MDLKVRRCRQDGRPLQRRQGEGSNVSGERGKRANIAAPFEPHIIGKALRYCRGLFVRDLLVSDTLVNVCGSRVIIVPA